jgi:crotonobetainyl-CoA:carnitine CoA-transferase CaiB-like acyl-CoA transferase
LIDLLYELTMTKDGAVTISAGTDEMQMRSLIAIGMEHLLADERFSSFDKLVANLEEFKALVASAYLEFTTDEIIEKLKAADVPCARCLNHEEVLAQEQLAANDSTAVIEHPIMGNMRVVKSPARFAGKRLEPSRPSPDHGEHTQEVLREFSIAEDRIAQMTDQGIVA